MSRRDGLACGASPRREFLIDARAHPRDTVFEDDGFFRSVPAARVFDVTCIDATLPNDEAMGDADQLRLGEHDAGSNRSIFEQHLDPGA